MTGSFAILLLALLPALPQEEAPPPSPGGGRAPVIAWWEREPLCKRLGIEGALRVKLAEELKNLEISYQILQTRLEDARKVQSRMLFDAASAEDAITRHNRDEVARLSGEMQEINLKARLLVRRSLSQDQLATVSKQFPDFFGLRWFRAPRGRVEQGNVVIHK